MISFVDLGNFHGKPELQKQFLKFEGNAENQALIMYNKNKRKEIELEEPAENINANANGAI